jgi:hypothetical protein
VHEAELTNLPTINEHLQTFKHRRAQWHERVESLNGHAWSKGLGR